MSNPEKREMESEEDKKNMSNPEKTKMIVEEETIDESDDYLWSDEEEGEIPRELVLGLPARSASKGPSVDATLNEAVAAAQLIVAAADEAMGKKDDETISEEPQMKRPRVLLEVKAGASGSNAIDSMVEGEPMKKAQKIDSTQLDNPPQDPPKCKAAEEGFGETVPASSAATKGLGFGTGGLGIDLNVVPILEEEEEGASVSIAKFDLNRSPPQEEEEEEEDPEEVKEKEDPKEEEDPEEEEEPKEEEDPEEEEEEEDPEEEEEVEVEEAEEKEDKAE